MKQTFLFLLACVLTCVLSSCTLLFGVSLPDSIDLKSADKARFNALAMDTFRVLARGQIQHNNQVTRIRLVALCDVDRYRFEILPLQTSIPLGIMVGGKEGFSYYNAKENKTSHAASSPTLVKRLLGVEVHAEELCIALSGRIAKKDIVHLGEIAPQHFLHRQRFSEYFVDNTYGLVTNVKVGRKLKTEPEINFSVFIYDEKEFPRKLFVNVENQSVIAEFSIKAKAVDRFSDSLFVL